MRLDPAAQSTGVRLASYDMIESTNSEALARARNGEQGPLWIVAEVQTAGRGRRGRSWESRRGNLFASLLLTDPAPAAVTPQMALVSALAVHDAVAAVAPSLRERLTLKWPNDLLCDDAKLAGILIEGEGTKPLTVVMGIGINCRSHPVDTTYPATDLAALGVNVTLHALLTALSRTMLERLAQWNRGAGFAGIRSDWVDRAGAPGRAVRVQLSERIVEGRYDGLDAFGHLLVRRADGGLETIGAGDVFPMAPAPAGAVG